ncbi:MAG: hypothetical protein LBS64_03670, partial [Spirochaetaceae bacterium]|nr:hypothetical protein [Spirochaetaceae bacterium]
MKPIILCALAVALVSSFSYGAGLPAADMNAAGDGTVDVSIKLYNKAVYFVDHTADNPILVNVTVKNTGAETLRFKLADDRMFSVDFIARAMRNSVLPPSAILLRKRALRQAVYFREIALENGEAYSFVENLRDYLDIS